MSVFALVAAASWAGAAAAQPCAKRGWDLKLGLGGGSTPDYIGSDSDSATLVPYIEGRWCTDSLGSVSIDTAGSTLGSGTLTWAFIDGDEFQLGLQLGLRSSRDDSASGALRLRAGSPNLKGLNRIDSAVDFGPVVGINLFGVAPWFLQARTAGSDNGWVIQTGLQLAVEPAKGFTVGVIPAYTLASASVMRRYFGVTPAESSRSRFREYRPAAGSVGASIELFVEYAFAGAWSVIADGGYTRLSRQAADSPIVTQRNQFASFALIAYRF
jgi:outer membrane scaffolding protein for murein synthesis (MipA/OmpV family)